MRNLALGNQTHVMPEKEKAFFTGSWLTFMEESAIIGTKTEALFHRVLATNLVQGNYLELLLYWRQKKCVVFYTVLFSSIVRFLLMS